MKTKLLVFIDALPFEHKYLFEKYINNWNLELSPLKPSYGFSSNQHNLLLRGLLPDAANFFTDYTIISKNKFSYYFRHTNWFTFIFRKIQSRIGTNRANIPLGMGHMFKQVGIYPLSSKNKLDSVTKDFHHWDFYADLDAFKKLTSLTISRDTFLVFNHIDHLGHYKGLDSKDYKSAVEMLFDKIDKYLKKNNVDFLLFSDHGMSCRPKKVKLVLEKKFGKQSNNGYVYFIDSTTLKVWVKDNKLKTRIINYLNDRAEGSVIDEMERKAHGLTNIDFGDIIFVLGNDYYFEPQYFGFGIKSKTYGMHGNSPHDRNQWGVWAGNNQLGECDDSRYFFKDILTKFIK